MATGLRLLVTVVLPEREGVRDGVREAEAVVQAVVVLVNGAVVARAEGEKVPVPLAVPTPALREAAALAESAGEAERGGEAVGAWGEGDAVPLGDVMVEEEGREVAVPPAFASEGVEWGVEEVEGT